MIQKIRHGTDFRTKAWEPVFKGIKKSYEHGEPFSIRLPGGAASGKTFTISENICFWLPEVSGDVALFIVADTTHKERMFQMYKDLLSAKGYKYHERTLEDKTKIIDYGNDNQVIVISVGTSKLSNKGEKFKTPIVNGRRIKFIWWEEFTTTFNFLGSAQEVENIRSRLARMFKKDYCEFYTYNPPNDNDPILDWANSSVIPELHTTIYMLPPRAQDPATLAIANTMRDNPDTHNTWRWVYCGETIGGEDQAFRNVLITNDVPIFIEYLIVVDNGTDHATTFTLMGLTKTGEIHAINQYYHSGENEGYKSQDVYFIDFLEWFNSLRAFFTLDLNTEIMTDEKSFAILLANRGFNAYSVSEKITKRVHRLLRVTRAAFSQKKLYLWNIKENYLMIQQFTNLKTIYKTVDGKTRQVPKKTEGKNIPETRKMHGVDGILYGVYHWRTKIGVE